MKRPLILPALLFILGIVIVKLSGGFIPGYSYAVGALAALIIILALLFMRTDKLFYVLISLFFLVLGLFRFSSVYTHEKSNLLSYIVNDDNVILAGTVTGYAEIGEKYYSKFKSFEMEAERLIINENQYAVKGPVYVRLTDYGKTILTGDKIAVGGSVFIPDNKKTDFVILNSKEHDYFYKSGKSKSPVLAIKREVYKARNKAYIAVKKILTGDSLAVTSSILLGLRGDLDKGVKDLFIKTGTMHILAVSGLHVGVCGGIFIFLLKLTPAPEKIIFITAIIFIWGFAVFAGARPSSMRAALMGTFMLVSLIAARDYSITDSVVLSAFFITFFSPAELFKSSFILSYMAVLSIVYILPLLNFLFKVSKPQAPYGKENIFTKLKRYVVETFLLSLAVWIGMFPLIAYYFDVVTPGALIANFIAIPFLFMAMITGFLVIVTCLLTNISYINYVLSLFMERLTEYFLKFLELISKIPYSHFDLKLSSPYVLLLYYAGMALAIAYTRKKIRKCLAGE